VPSTSSHQPVSTAAPTSTAGSVRDRALVPVLMFMGMVVAVVSSLGAPLIPSIAVDYNVSVGGAQWSLTIALLVGAVTAPILGRLGDGPQRRNVMLSTLGLVMFGSILAALPLSYLWLLVGRGMQGVGLGLMPLAMTLARDQLPAPRSRSTVAILSITASAGVGLGYPLTGLFADTWGFHAPFWFGAAISALALILAAAVLPSSRHLSRRPMDATGAVLLSAGLVALLLCLSEGESWGWTSGRLLLVAVTAAALLAGWAWHQLRTSSPLVNLRLMRNRTVLTANVTGLFAGLGMYMLLPLVTRYVQAPTSTGYGFGASIVVAGLVLLPFSVASVAASRLLPVVSRRLGSRLVLPLGALFLVGSLSIFLFARAELWEAFLVLGIAGLGTGLIFAAIPGLIVGSVPSTETGSALGVNQVIRQVGFSIGSALGAAILTQHTIAPDPLPTDAGYSVSAIIGIGLCLLTALLSFLLPSRKANATGALDTVEERQLMDEAADGSAGGMMLLDAESVEAELMSSNPVDDSDERPYGRHAATGGAGPRRSDFALVRR
jgi:predicted MFS family arabinose efflux permease